MLSEKHLNESEVSKEEYIDLLKTWPKLIWNPNLVISQDNFNFIMEKPIKYTIFPSNKFAKCFKRLGGSFSKETFFPKIQMVFNAVTRGLDSKLGMAYSHHEIKKSNTQNIHIGGDPSIEYSFPNANNEITLFSILDHAGRGY